MDYNTRWILINRLKSGLLFWMALLCVGLALPSDAVAANDKIRIESGSQPFAPFEGGSMFMGGVKVAMEGTQVTGPAADIKMGKDGKAESAVFTNRAKMVRKNGGMNQTIQADTLNMGLQDGALKATGKVQTNMSGDSKMGNVSISSDTQIFDQEKHIMRAIGHVSVTKGDMKASSPEAIILMGPDGGAEKVVFTKGAKLVQGGQEMRAETITIQLETGNIYAERNTQSTMMGNDSQGKPTRIKITSHLQELNKETGNLIANGNAVVHYDDYVAKGPKAVFYRNAQEELDHIVMTGRAEIEDPERKVTGDTVVITVNPRQFNAKGNVTTFIKSKQSQVASKATGDKAKPANAVHPAAANGVEEAAPQEASQSAWDQEQMIEQMTNQDGNGSTP